MTTLILASASPIRAQILRDAGIAFETRPARIDEEAARAGLAAEGLAPLDHAAALARMKAARVSARAPGAWALGCDQTLLCAGARFDKPADIPAARAQLQALRGKRHELICAAAIFRDGAEIWRHVARPALTMRPFSDAFLDAYLAQMGDEVCESAGGYKLEGLGAQLFAGISGDYFSILGLPLLPLLGFLRANGALIE